MNRQEPYEQLHLSDLQKSAIRAIRTARQKELKALRTEWQRAENDVVHSEHFDEQKATELISVHYRAMKDKEEISRLRAQNAMYNTLNPEQKLFLQQVTESEEQHDEPAM